MNRASGCLFGLALGDALGARVEFMTVNEILAHFPPDGPMEPAGDPARVTDDTQMALAVGEALVEASASGPLTPLTLEGPLRRAFIEWLRSPENDRAPGMTCLRSCENLTDGRPWHEATQSGSKGCGANMRVAPVGLLSRDANGSVPSLSAISQFQAALTHGHPTALAASDLTATAVAYLLRGDDPKGLTTSLQAYAESQRLVYHEKWLGPLWQRAYLTSPEQFIERGWDECLGVLDRLERAMVRPDREADPCLATGLGWVAEEAFATGLLCFLLFPDDPVAALRRAALTSGDSDSVACLAGAFAGACHGMNAWPEPWVSRIEYRDRLAALGQFFDSAMGAAEDIRGRY